MLFNSTSTMMCQNLNIMFVFACPTQSRNMKIACLLVPFISFQETKASTMLKFWRFVVLIESNKIDSYTCHDDLKISFSRLKTTIFPFNKISYSNSNFNEI